MLVSQTTRAQDNTTEPIAAAGHGGFFAQDGKQVPLSLSFVSESQRWYRERLVRALSNGLAEKFSAFEQRLYSGLDATPQDALLLQHRALEWLLANTTETELLLQTAAKVRALGHELSWVIPERGTLKVVDQRAVYKPSRAVARRLRELGIEVASLTVNSGQAYLDECAALGVPIPPPINVMDSAGLTGWKSEGFIPTSDQFIVSTPAELRSYRSTSPEGMCYALPRYTDASLSEVKFDGVICMGKQSSKVCFWDNQWTVGGIVQSFRFPAGTQIPIGVPSVPGGKYQAGGKEIEFGPGGVCTDCHAGENPYITHPKSVLSTSPFVRWEDLFSTLPTMPVNRYDPLVGASWPQNQSSQAAATVPSACSGCHRKGSNGRFPHLSNKLPQYCSTVLTNAYHRTMPPTSPGSAVTAAEAFRDAWCFAPPTATSEDTGDPHITTTNGVHYDFQAAGEFVALRSEDIGFELQTRQSPVLTTFVPGPNAYTGLASCVSLNTAVAVRANGHRVSYLPKDGAFAGADSLVLRVDGADIDPWSVFDLGDGNAVVPNGVGGPVTVRLSDRSEVLITPRFWPDQGYWYLDVKVSETTAREGVMGHILAGNWLPLAPDGSSFGPMPGSLLDRHYILNRKFADVWRVDASTSLFDYQGGQSSKDFTDVNWPPESGKPCDSTTVLGPLPVVKEPQPQLAKEVCREVRDPAAYENCVYDVTVMGDPAVAKAYLK